MAHLPSGWLAAVSLSKYFADGLQEPGRHLHVPDSLELFGFSDAPKHTHEAVEDRLDYQYGWQMSRHRMSPLGPWQSPLAGTCGSMNMLFIATCLIRKLRKQHSVIAVSDARTSASC